VARIAPISDATPEQAALLERSLGAHGKPLNLFSTLAHHPSLLKQFMRLGGLLLQKNSISDRDREIVILRIAARSGCDYIVFQHREIALGCGLSNAEIDVIVGLQSVEQDATLIAAVDDLDTRNCVSAEIFSGLMKMYSTSQVIEIIFLAGFYHMVAGFLLSLEVDVDTEPVDAEPVSYPIVPPKGL